MNYYLGIDVGSINVKLALRDETGRTLHFASQKIISNPKTTVNVLLNELDRSRALNQITGVGVSGTGKAIIPQDYHWAEYSSSLAIASGLLHSDPDVRTIIQIGGQSSLVIELEDGLKKPWKVASNPLCAAGTGRFLEQQAYRLGIRIEDFGPLALQFQGSAPRIAARCSVFAKSDLIHLQQKGVSVEAMIYALCESIARMVIALKKGPFIEPVYFVGGVAANGAIAKALNYEVYWKLPNNYRALINAINSGKPLVTVNNSALVASYMKLAHRLTGKPEQESKSGRGSLLRRMFPSS